VEGKRNADGNCTEKNEEKGKLIIKRFRARGR